MLVQQDREGRNSPAALLNSGPAYMLPYPCGLRLETLLSIRSTHVAYCASHYSQRTEGSHAYTTFHGAANITWRAALKPDPVHFYLEGYLEVLLVDNSGSSVIEHIFCI